MESIKRLIGELLRSSIPRPCRLLCALLIVHTLTLTLPLAQGGAAVITLVMPVGARQLGMGETAIAVANDPFATFWNPAGLAFGPLSDEWEMVLQNVFRKNDIEMRREFTVLAAKQRSGFLFRPIVWAGSKDGLLRYDGKTWRDYHEYVMEVGDEIDKVVRKYVGTGENLDSLVARVRRYNNVTTEAEEKALISLKLPYGLLFKGPVNAVILDNLERLWVGTDQGLFRFNGTSWKSFEAEKGFGLLERDGELRPRRVSALAVKGSSIWIGTEDGLFEYKRSALFRRGGKLLPNQHVTSIATHENIRELYIGMQGKGVARYTPSRGNEKASWRLFDRRHGMLDDQVDKLLLDRYGHVWAGHAGGVSHFSLRSWEKIHFKNQEVSALALGEDGSIWIGTDQGAWKHTPAYTHAKGRKAAAKEAEEGELDEKHGGWVHYHTGNGLVNRSVIDIEVQGDDVWFITGAGIERYNTAKTQVGFFYENLLPVLQLKDLFHAFMGFTFPVQDWGTVGGFINFVSFGENTQVDENGVIEQTFNSREWVGALSYGTKLTRNSSLGLNVKFIYSALAPGSSNSGEETDGIAASYALDVALLRHDLWLKGLSLGMVLQNIGPAVFYVDQAQSDPIPFTWKLGMAYRLFETPNHKLTIAGDINREAYGRDDNNRPLPVYIGAWQDLVDPCDEEAECKRFEQNLHLSVYNTGVEYIYANVVAARAGYLYDRSGQRFELDLGLGFAVSDILQLDGSFIRSFDGGIRDGQMRFSMNVKF